MEATLLFFALSFDATSIPQVPQAVLHWCSWVLSINNSDTHKREKILRVWRQRHRGHQALPAEALWWGLRVRLLDWALALVAQPSLHLNLTQSTVLPQLAKIASVSVYSALIKELRRDSLSFDNFSIINHIWSIRGYEIAIINFFFEKKAMKLFERLLSRRA